MAETKNPVLKDAKEKEEKVGDKVLNIVNPLKNEAL